MLLRNLYHALAVSDADSRRLPWSSVVKFCGGGFGFYDALVVGSVWSVVQAVGRELVVCVVAYGGVVVVGGGGGL